jgi:hypothetical protein
LVVLEFNTSEIQVFFSLIPFMKAKFINICGIYFNLLNLIACMFMLGAFGKSALDLIN